MSPATGVDYLDKRLPDIIEHQDRDQHDYLHQAQASTQQEKQDDDLVWPDRETSAIAQVYAQFEDEGVKRWPQKNVEWLMVYLLTEIATTPHSMRSGYASPSILDAYDAVVQQLVSQIRFR